MNNTPTRFLYLAFVLAIMFDILPFSMLAQELPSGMTKEEFCAMRASGTMPTKPEGVPQQGAGFPGGGAPPEGFQPPEGGMSPEGMQRPAGRAMPGINCDDVEAGMSPAATSSAPTKPVVPVAPKTPATQQAQPSIRSTTTIPRTPAAVPASSTREKSKLDQLIKEDAQRAFYGSETTFSNGASDNTKQNTGFLGVIVSTVASVVRNVLGWFQR